MKSTYVNQLTRNALADVQFKLRRLNDELEEHTKSITQLNEQVVQLEQKEDELQQFLENNKEGWK